MCRVEVGAELRIVGDECGEILGRETLGAAHLEQGDETVRERRLQISDGSTEGVEAYRWQCEAILSDGFLFHANIVGRFRRSFTYVSFGPLGSKCRGTSVVRYGAGAVGHNRRSFLGILGEATVGG